MRHRSYVPAAVGMLLVLTACGGDDDAAPADAADSRASQDDAAAPADGSDAAESPDETAAAGEAVADPSSTSSFGEPGTGMIEIGDLRHELTVTRCVSMAGAMGGDAVSVSEPDNVSISFSFSPEDWQDRNASEGWSETGSVRLDNDEPYLQWATGISSFEGFNLPDGIAAADLDITAIDISDDGRSARGEAMFAEVNSLFTGGDVLTATGSFEFTCPDT